jgi:hypothetical protein
MAYVNVNDPKKLQEVDPKITTLKEPEDVAALNNEVKKARARRELVQENQLTDNIMNPPTPEAPFKVSGGINLGQIDIQAEQNRIREEAARERAEAQRRIEVAQQEAASARNALNEANLKHLQDTLTAQLDSMRSAIQSGNRGDFSTELEKIEAAASKLGLARPQAGGQDLNAMLALEKFKLDNKREDRKFALEMKRDERMWQLELKKLEQASLESAARADAERSKYKFLADLPEQIGGVVTNGLLAKAGGISGQPAAAQPAGAPPQRQQTPRQLPKKEVRAIEAGEGEAGVIGCPVCGTEVGVGPTTVNTICAGCQQKFVIKRVPVAPPEPQEKEPVGADLDGRQ